MLVFNYRLTGIITGIMHLKMTEIKAIKEWHKSFDWYTLMLKTSIVCSEGPYPFQL